MDYTSLVVALTHLSGSSLFARALPPALIFLCGLGLSIWSGEYLYRDRQRTAVTLFCFGLILLGISINMWSTA